MGKKINPEIQNEKPERQFERETERHEINGRLQDPELERQHPTDEHGQGGWNRQHQNKDQMN